MKLVFLLTSEVVEMEKPDHEGASSLDDSQ